jgi:4a-hydroxytetrahydrobiopterin dehydratase
MMLKAMKCKPCEGGVLPMKKAQASKYLKGLDGWILAPSSNSIRRKFSFANFKEALDFINKVGTISEKEGHHPDIYLHSWNKVDIKLYTHAIGGLSINDFVVAAKIDAIIG